MQRKRFFESPKMTRVRCFGLPPCAPAAAAYALTAAQVACQMWRSARFLEKSGWRSTSTSSASNCLTHSNVQHFLRSTWCTPSRDIITRSSGPGSLPGGPSSSCSSPSMSIWSSARVPSCVRLLFEAITRKMRNRDATFRAGGVE